jgi:hypothetical protein
MYNKFCKNLSVLSRLLNPINEEVFMKQVRNRAWRRFNNYNKIGKGQASNKIIKPEKKWKMMYTRSEKLVRAKQFGFEYPRKKLVSIIDEK